MLLAVVLWRPIIGILAIGWADLMTSHSFLIWYGLIGILLFLGVVGGVFFRLLRK